MASKSAQIKKIAKEETDSENFNYVRAFKNNWHWIVLIAFIILGANLRLYHIDYPAIGYHNMKENIYLMYAEHMYDGEGIFKLSVNYLASNQNNYQKDMLPLISWGIVILWKIFGHGLLWPRLLMVFFSLANILLIYILVMQLSKRKELSLISSLLMAIMPIGVFFGRNIQPDIPGVTFILLFSIYLYKWIKTESRKDFILFSVFLGIAFNLKLTNIVGLFPFIFIFPYKRVLKDISSIKKHIPEALIAGFSLSTAYIWKYAQEFIMPNSSTVYDSITSELFKGLSASYWANSKSLLLHFIIDNFTIFYIWLAIFGLILMALKYRTSLSRYTFGFFIGLIVYFLIVPGYMVRHNYYQAPFLVLVVIAAAYFIFIAGTFFGELLSSLGSSIIRNEIIRKENIKIIIKTSSIYFFAFVVVFLSWSSVMDSINRQFDTQFFGTDVAGDYIKSNSLPSEKVFLAPDPSGQTYNVLWYADRHGAAIPASLETFKKLEDEKNFKWIFAYGGSLHTLEQNTVYSEVWPYINENYEIAQAGVLVLGPNNQQARYFILKKGRALNLSELNELALLKAKDYELTGGIIPFYTATSS